MKKKLLRICSILLILTCLFGLMSCLAGLADVANIQEYKLADSAEAKDGLAQAREGIEELGENELTYIDGVKAYEEGIDQLKLAQVQLVSGQALLTQSEADLSAGQAELDANTQAYLEGKAQLEKIAPLMPYVDAYVNFRDNKLETINGFDNVQAWFIARVKPVAARNGIDIPDNVDDLSAYVQGIVADGEAKIRMYEEGQAQLEQGKNAIASGYAAVEDGKQQYSDGKKQLEEGDVLLKEYEEGQAQLADGMNQFLREMTASTRRSGEQTVPSLSEMLGSDWNLYKLDENGRKIQYRECDFVDIDACEKLCDTAEQYMELSEADVTAELMARVATYAVAAIACIFGLIAGIAGIVGSKKQRTKTGSIPGIICAVFAVIANIIGIGSGYRDYIYGTRDADKVISYSGDGQFKALIALAVVSIIFAVVSTIAKKKTKEIKNRLEQFNY